MKISLITACYNSAGTIRTAIESVLAQRGVVGKQVRPIFPPLLFDL